LGPEVGMAEQKLWLIEILVTADEDEVETITDRLGAAVCVPPDHEGPCSTPWTTLRVAVDDLEEPRRSELRALAEYS